MEFRGFEKKVYEVVKTIPKGQVRTYKWVAEKMGNPQAYRAVGNALNKNPCPSFARPRGRRAHPIIVPCHRVVKADGSLGGFAKGQKEKLRLLKREGLTLEKIDGIIKRQREE